MKKTRLAATFLGSLLLVVAIAGPSLAGDRGGRHYTWPAHCSTDLLLVIHTYQPPKGMDVAFGRAKLTSCSGSAGVTAVSVQYLLLWKHSETDPTPVQIADYQPVPVLMAGNFWTLDTVERGCRHPIKDPGGILPGDTAWVNMKYKIQWGDGTYTIMRNDNSYAFTFDQASDCT